MALIPSWDDWGKLTLRLSIGGMLLLHGFSKLQNGIAWMADVLKAAHLPVFLGYGVFVGEVIAPLMLIAGIYTRAAGLIVAFNLFMAIMLARRADLFALNQGGGWGVEVEALFLLGGVAIFFLGGGKFAVRKGPWD